MIFKSDQLLIQIGCDGGLDAKSIAGMVFQSDL